jgi:plasmid stabilization system protein ParE
MKVFWTKFALNSLADIYKYYKENVSLIIAFNIRESVLTCTRQLEKHPLSGAKEEILEELEEGHRFLVRGNYKIIYKILDKKVYITDVFDTRQDPEKIKQRNK